MHGTSGLARDRKKGEFFLGSTTEPLPHRYGAWGTRLGFASWENAPVVLPEPETLAGKTGSLWLVPQYDAG